MISYKWLFCKRCFIKSRQVSRLAKERSKDESPRELREEILEILDVDLKKSDQKSYSTMTRLRADYIEILDALVKLEIFRSRSEAIASIVMKTLNSEMDLFQQLIVQAKRKDEMEETVKDLAIKALKE